MKRFVVLIILIAFAAESYAGQSNVRWMMSQGEFEKDREECIESIDKNLNSDAFGKALEECMAKKGYESEPSPRSDNEKSKTVKIAKTVGKVLLVTAGVTLLVAVTVALAGAYVVAGAFAGAGR